SYAHAATTTYGYDALNRVTAVTDGLGHVSSTAYDAASNVTSQTDANGNVTTFAYDVRNRQTGVTAGAGTAAAHTPPCAYDPAGHRVSQPPALGAAGSAHASPSPFSSEALNRTPGETQAVGTAAHRSDSTTYDPASNVLSQTDWRGNVTSFAYNARNQ